MRRALFAALACAACGAPVLGVRANIVTTSCSGQSPSISQLRITLTGDGLAAQSSTVEMSSGSAQFPAVPIGTNRRLAVDGLSGGQIVAHADSGPFDALGPDDISLDLFLRATGAFDGSEDGSGACTHMISPRAGHGLALLADGRVLISGGYSLENSTPPQLVYRDDAEIYDPHTGTFTAVQPGPLVRRAGFAALALTSGILLAGGEGPSSASGVGPVTASRPLELFSQGLWTELTPPAASPSRSHTAAAVDLRTGSAIFAGGQAGPDTPGVSVYASVSFFDPAGAALHDAAATLRAGQLTDAVAVARQNGSLGGVVLVGGRDQAGTVLAQISGLVWAQSPAGNLDYIDDATYKAAAFQLPTPRSHHVALRRLDDTILTAGGVTSMTVGAFDYSAATNEITVIDPAGGTVADLPIQLSQARADSCAALLDDGTALIAGGAWKDSSGLHSGAQVDLVGANEQLKSASMKAPRHRAACIELRDGTVLVSGGLQYPAGGGTPVVRDSVEIYTP